MKINHQQQCARPFQSIGFRANTDSKNRGVHHTAESYIVMTHNKLLVIILRSETHDQAIFILNNISTRLKSTIATPHYSQPLWQIRVVRNTIVPLIANQLHKLHQQLQPPSKTIAPVRLLVIADSTKCNMMFIVLDTNKDICWHITKDTSKREAVHR